MAKSSLSVPSCSSEPFSLNEDSDDLVEVLNAADIELVVIHRLLGFGPAVVEALDQWCRGRRTIAYVHDFYPICPRVTLIDAVNTYCGVAKSGVCDRCIAFGGVHEASKLDMLTATEHPALFSRLLSGVYAVVACSEDAARHVRRAFPRLSVRAIPHPEFVSSIVSGNRLLDPFSIVLLGGIGPQKGAAKLPELARLAALTHPE